MNKLKPCEHDNYDWLCDVCVSEVEQERDKYRAALESIRIIYANEIGSDEFVARSMNRVAAEALR